MAGLGRRTHYRKHVTDAVLNDLPEPAADESIAVVVATRGSNQFDVRLPHEAESRLAILPTKFRKLVWLKRNDYVIVQTSDTAENDENIQGDDDPPSDKKPSGDDAAESSSTPPVKQGGDEPSEETGSIRCMVTHILYSDQIKHLKSKGLWAIDDPGFANAAGEAADTPEQTQSDDQALTNENNDGIVYDSAYGLDSENEDDDLFVNTNRISRITIQDDSSSDED
uniref:S1-like domain-containing protein n=1 Tax=Entomoneis paludosa TaxID=265537 RepID=A0A7S3DUU6_9STRA|eukprot:CAMPEP_0172458656 /NCGR_PEP_ID=MMETSP1065-20121228/28588_1 /TAXON_ID=265537 /ORGANISM="Amphiprora paludosa, Strain CCMP125" /LENGTH=224 /DNA_ID=CAMNT_0013213015 /DNA_START=15 /DNA_END=689 /DNA_ORIENTATION=-